MTPPKVFLGVPMAVGVRDVLRSDVLRGLRQAGVEVHIFSAAAEDPEFVREFEAGDVRIHALRRPPTHRFRWLDRAVLKLYVLVLSMRCETAHIMVAKTMEESRVARTARAVLRLLGPRWTDRLVRAARALARRAAPDLYGEEFRAERPDLVIGTRVLTMTTAFGEVEDRYLDRWLVMSAARHGVPTMVIVASWDNLTSKGFFPVEPDRLTVWNPIMRDEAITLHGLAPARITVTGAPQHDVYARAPYQTKDAFCRSLGLDPARPLIVYATQTAGTVPDEPLLVQRIHERLSAELGARVQVLVRLHQLDHMERYARLVGREGLVFDHAGTGRLGAYPDRHFDEAALRRLADTLAHADVVLNCASSISIDAAAVGTPVVAVAFDPEGDVPYWRSVRRYFDFTHQQHVVRSGGVRVAPDLDALVREVRAYLADRQRDAAGRAHLVERLCHRVDGGSGKRVADAVLQQLGAAPGAAQAPYGRSPAEPVALARPADTLAR